MMKWFEEVNRTRPAVICSRVRLVRNLEQYAFPSRLDGKLAEEMIGRLEDGLKDLGTADGRHYEQARLQELSDLDRRALRERRVFNSTIASGKAPAGVMVSDDERVGIVLNGTDHIRIQLFASGLHLDELWTQAGLIDDYLNERFDYAFDDKYGYLTSFPTSVGTGLRASVVLHLPLLSQSKRFNGMVTEMTRFGASVKGMYGEGDENCGSLYDVSNQKTLGMTEKEILDMVAKVALQLTAQEEQMRKLALDKNRVSREDDAFRAYGTLKYARKLTIKEAMTLLSRLMAGCADGLLRMEEPCAVYRLMLGIQPANLQKLSARPLGREELEMARAAYLRAELPQLLA